MVWEREEENQHAWEIFKELVYGVMVHEGEGTQRWEWLIVYNRGESESGTWRCVEEEGKKRIGMKPRFLV